MIQRISILLFFLATYCTIFFSCKNNNMEELVSNSNYPPAIERIIVNKCATAGCHNTESYQNAGGLQLDTWEHMFEGGSTGAAVIPYSIDNSSLLYFINTNMDLGPMAAPTMPYNGTPLSQDEYLTIRNWIASGAPDKSGSIPFSAGQDTRQKIYMTQQGCDLVTVIDAKSRQVTRYIPVGTLSAIESPHCVRVTDDGMAAYVSFLGGQFIQKIDTRTDQVVDSIQVGVGSWNVFKLSPDGKHMMLSDWEGNGKLLFINLETKDIQTLAGGSLFAFPHGVASNPTFDTFYVTAQYGNIVYKATTDGYYKQVLLDGNPPTTGVGHLDPHEIMMTPDCSKYFLTCEFSNEVRVMDAHADTLIKVIPVGIKPQEIAVSPSKHLMFITCMEDVSSNAGFKGSVYAINYDTYEVLRIDGQFYQPHGITVDEQNGMFYVVSRNANPNGPAPHHSSSCAGRNGYYNVFDLNTFQRLSTRYEVVVEPYSADTRFK